MKVLSSDEIEKSRIILHKNDQKILALLCKNVRLPLSKIAKLLGMSRQSVEYRINIMMKNNLLIGSRTVINIKKLGYSSYHFFLNISSDSAEKTFKQRCLQESFVNALINYSGKWNYELSIMESSPEKAMDRFQELIKNIEINDYFSIILLENIKSSVLPGVNYNKIIKNIKNDPSFSKQFLEKPINYSADSIDKEILYLLSQNAEITLSNISRKTRLSKDAVSYRIKKLIRSNYILEFRPVINFDSLGLSIQAILIKENSTTPIDKSKLKSYLEKSNQVLWATRIFGEWNYLIYSINKNPDEIHNLIRDIKKEFPIKSYELIYAYNEYKYSFMSENILKS